MQRTRGPGRGTGTTSPRTWPACARIFPSGRSTTSLSPKNSSKLWLVEKTEGSSMPTAAAGLVQWSGTQQLRMRSSTSSARSPPLLPILTCPPRSSARSPRCAPCHTGSTCRPSSPGSSPRVWHALPASRPLPAPGHVLHNHWRPCPPCWPCLRANKANDSCEGWEKNACLIGVLLADILHSRCHVCGSCF